MRVPHTKLAAGSIPAAISSLGMVKAPEEADPRTAGDLYVPLAGLLAEVKGTP